MLIFDRFDRVWILAETCAACAEAIPRAKVLSGGHTPPPAVPPPAAAEPARVVPSARPKISDGERARNCPVCAAAAHALQSGAEEDPGDNFAGAPQRGSTPAVFGEYAMDVLEYLDHAGVGTSPETRVAALMCALRARSGGHFMLAHEDLGEQRWDLPDAALTELIGSGWLDASLDQIRSAARPGPAPGAVQCRIPDLGQGTSRMGLPTSARPRCNGWAQRLFVHPLLAGQTAGVRLGAFYITANCKETGRGQIRPREMAALCCYTSHALAVPVMRRLLRAGWLTRCEPAARPSAPVSVLVSQRVREFVPGAVRATQASRSPMPAPINLSGREYAVARWVDEYVTRHGHGPRIRDLIASQCLENPEAPWVEAQMWRAARELADTGWLRLDGNRWYRIRPGASYERRLARRRSIGQQPGTPPRGAPASPHHSTSLRAPCSSSSDPACLDMPAQAAHQPPASRAASEDDESRLSGLWLIPGAEAVLGPRPA
ncbi:hypothetical protein ACH4FX_41915 [Streptomyces sp. NPDC018019]|uniref:hypothetical protein n=1 Tax=Streptomyces sp. NPDC018019 TaxID=3365030 RepID=UPI0037A00A20